MKTRRKLAAVERAYSQFEIKTVDEDQRIIEGIATTPTPDRMSDIVEPLGASYELPLPFLWQHDSDQPVGHVISAKPTKKGIPVTIKMAQIDIPGKLKDRLDEAWQSIKIGLVRGLSIGFAPKEYSYIEETYGVHFLEWDWLELSAVTIPANAEAGIEAIKSLDRKARAAFGTKRIRVVNLAGDSASKQKLIKDQKSMKISEQIKQLMQQRKEKELALELLQKEVSEGGKTKDAQQREQFDTLSDEIEVIDGELKDCRRMEAIQKSNAKAVVEDPSDDEIDADDPKVLPKVKDPTRGKHLEVVVPKKLEKGILFARFVKCLGASKGDISGAIAIANQHYKDTSPQIGRVLRAMRDGGSLEVELQKTAIAGGTTTDSTWAGPLVEYNQFAGDFIEFLRPSTILGKFGGANPGGGAAYPSLRQIPFNVHIRGQTTGGQGYWVGQGKPKPLTKFDFSDVYMGWNKVAAISVLTEELLRFSNPSAEALVRDSIADALRERLDIDFINPSKAAVSNTSPASITNGVTAHHSSGSTADHVRADISTLVTDFITNNITPGSAVFIMPATIALKLSLLRNAFGQKEFPEVNQYGGWLEGIPVITSQYVPSATAGAIVVLANASDIYLADDGQVTIDASREASLQMLDNPTNASSDGTATSVVSMFQTNSVALRAERFVNWQKRRAAAVSVLDQVVWSG